MLSAQETQETQTTQTTQITPVNQDKPKKTLTWNGLRPFAGAYMEYLKIMYESLQRTKAWMESHPWKPYGKVFVDMFAYIFVETQDEEGNKVLKDYEFSNVHLGPRKYVDLSKSKYWDDFYDRDQKIWENLGLVWKIPPFRVLQFTELAMGFYLIDNSSIVHTDMGDGKVKTFFKVDIRLYREIPKDGPFRHPHGYGFIPGLGPVKNTSQTSQTRQTSQTDKPRQEYVKLDLSEFPSLGKDTEPTKTVVWPRPEPKLNPKPKTD